MPIEVKNLSVEFNKCHLIKNISTSFEYGVVTSIIGANGCGKSTLLNSIGGQITNFTGTISVDGNFFKDLNAKDRAKLIAHMPQSFEIEGNLLVSDFFHYSRFPQMRAFRPLLSDEIALQKEICSDLKISHLLNRKVSEVSGGELKKIAIGAAFFQGGRYVLLDEPFQALDPVVKSEVACFLKGALCKYHCSIVMSCHDLYWAQELSQNILLLKKGDVFESGDANELMTPKIMQSLYGEKFIRYSHSNQDGERFILVPKGLR